MREPRAVDKTVLVQEVVVLMYDLIGAASIGGLAFMIAMSVLQRTQETEESWSRSRIRWEMDHIELTRPDQMAYVEDETR